MFSSASQQSFSSVILFNFGCWHVAVHVIVFAAVFVVVVVIIVVVCGVGFESVGNCDSSQ